MPTGPPELRAVGADAESMRRALLAEADARPRRRRGARAGGPGRRGDPRRPRRRQRPDRGRARGARPGRGGARRARRRLVGRAAARGRPHRRCCSSTSPGHGELAGLVLQRLRSVMTVALRSGFDAGHGARPVARCRSATRPTAGSRPRSSPSSTPTPATVAWANAGHPAGWLLPGRRLRSGVPRSLPPGRCSRPSAARGRPSPPRSPRATSCSSGPTGSSRRATPSREMSDDRPRPDRDGHRHPRAARARRPGCWPTSARSPRTGAATTSRSSPSVASPDGLPPPRRSADRLIGDSPSVQARSDRQRQGAVLARGARRRW